MPTSPSREVLRARANAIPPVEGGEIVGEKDALAMLFDLKRLGSNLPEHLTQQHKSIFESLLPELELSDKGDYYVLDGPTLYAAIARAVKGGAAQAISDIGQPLAENRLLEELLMTEQAGATEPPAEYS